MKLNKNFTVTEVAGDYIAIPVDDAADILHGIIRLNEAGKLIWDGLDEGLDELAIAKRICNEYEVDEATALQDIRDVMAKLKDAGILTD